MLEMAYNNFALWTKTGHTPEILKEIKIAYIPKQTKVHQRAIPIKGLRPITVFSIFWRCYSALWLRSPLLDSLHRLLPKDICCRASAGPEAQAATIDSILKVLPSGVTLDFSSCFDTINLEVIGSIYCQED